MIINIYLTETEKNRLKEIKYKYHLSFSTIANIIVQRYAVVLEKQMTETNLYERKGTKTSIKPKIWQYDKPTVIFTNALKIFTNKDLNKYIEDKKACEIITNHIYNDFQETWDDNWDGNEFNRKVIKFIKANPNYTQKVLDQAK